MIGRSWLNNSQRKKNCAYCKNNTWWSSEIRVMELTWQTSQSKLVVVMTCDLEGKKFVGLAILTVFKV